MSKSRYLPFFAFTAAFWALVGFVFWGTWSPDFAPVMPDCAVTHAANYLERWLGDWPSRGMFAPGDIYQLIPPYFRQELQYALALYFAALGVAYFLRGRGLGNLASYGSGLLLALSGYWITLFSAGHLGWFLWMPYGVFAFGLADRAVTTNRLKYWLLLGADVAWASFNQQDLWLLFSLFTAAYVVYALIRERKFPWKGLLAAAVTFFAVGLPNFIETLTVNVKGREAQIEETSAAKAKANPTETKSADPAAKKAERWEFVTNWSLPPEDTLEFVIPRVHGDTSCPICLSIAMGTGRDLKPYSGRLGRPLNAPSGNYRQHSLYVGWVTVLLALVALIAAVRHRDRREVFFFFGAAIICYLLSLGRFFEPAYRVIFALPFGDLIRCPVKWHHLTEFALVIMAGFGIEALARISAERGIKWARYALFALVAWGAIDLAVQDHRFCVPMTVKSARQRGVDQQTTILPRNAFTNPQVAEAAKRGQIVSLANYFGDPNNFLVEILKPCSPYQRPQPKPLRIALGIVSLLATLGVCAVGLRKERA